MANLISVNHLRFEYRTKDMETDEVRSHLALDDVSFDIERGSFVSIVGLNGSGKSTLAQCLNGLLLPTQGQILVDGMDTADDSLIYDIRSRVGMVFQNPDHQIVSSIVEEDVAFGPENLGIDPEEIRRRVDDALKAVGMEHAREKGPHMLSGGQKQRIAIAGALAMKPDCIIFDEPTAMLDPAGREQVVKLIHELNEEGITIILITHFMEEASEAERVIVMNRGKVLSDSTPDELFRNRELIREAGLELPTAAALADRVQEMDPSIKLSSGNVNELVEAICRSRQND